MKENLKAYFNFTKKERTGLAILLMIILIVAVAPAFFPGGPIVSDSTQLAILNQHLLLLETSKADSPGYVFDRARSDHGVESGRHSGARSGYREQALNPFPFDPNTLDNAGWLKLGVREKTAQTIKKYLSKGGRFRRPDDLLRIYGLSEETKRKLLPFVRIEGETFSKDSRKLAAASEVNKGNYADEVELPRGGPKPGDKFDGSQAAGSVATRNNYKHQPAAAFDINLADTIDFRSLPGIGPVLSKRIVQFRDKLGGFYSKDQIREVYGVHDTTFRKIESYLLCTPKVVKLNLNQADEHSLTQHPYFRRQVARAILAYRQEHGHFKDLAELRGLASITSEVYLKLLAYATL